MTSPETLELEAVDAALAGRYVAPEHAELAELALLLRDDRPEPSAAWATQLDRRVEAGFPGRSRRHAVWLRKAAPALAIAACLLPVVAGAALIDGGGDEQSSGGGEPAMPASREGGGGAMLEDAAVAPAPPRTGDPDSDARANRRQERSASLTIAVRRREVDGAASRASEVAADLGGFVQRSSVSSSGGGSLLLRVPSDQLDTAVQRLSRLGRVRDLSRNTVDITASVVSARERLTDARAERKV